MPTYTTPFSCDLPSFVVDVDPADARTVERIDASAQDVRPIHGVLRVTDTDVGDTLTARVVGTPRLTYSGGALPPLADLAALTSPSASGLATVPRTAGGPSSIGPTIRARSTSTSASG